jgi:hypothetical protein
MEIIPQVAGNKALVINAEFVKLTIFNDVANTADTTVYTFSSSYKDETIDGQNYTPLGGLLAVGVQQRDIRVTSADTSISLSSINGDNIFAVLGTKIRGSELLILRGFYDENYNLTNVYQRFSGIVTSYNISEDLDDLNNNDTFTVTINASSFKSVLSNRIAGRKTNGQSWKEFNPTDTSMDNVYSIADRTFDFGNKPTSGTTNSSAATTQASQLIQNNMGTR